MSLLFRAALSQGTRLCTPKCSPSFFKFNLNVCISNNNCRCKGLVTLSAPLQRNYSTKNDEIDDIKKTYTKDGKEIIYTGFLARNVRRIKLFSLCTSFLGLGVQPLIYTKAVAAGQGSSITIPVFALIGAFAIATPMLLHIITKRYILQIDYDEKNDKYIAYVYNILAMRKKIEFTPEDVTIPTILGMFTSCAIKGKPVFMDAKFFTDQSHYIRIMGYDKPIDLQVNTNESTSKKDDNN